MTLKVMRALLNQRESAEKGAIVVPRTTAVVLIAVCSYLR
jgi:hypothetical protein